MKVLSQHEQEMINGGFANFALGAGIGLISYAWQHDFKLSEMTWSGAGLAAGAGALTGGVGGMAIKAAGGGIVGNAVWRPGIIGLNSGIQKSIAHNK